MPDWAVALCEAVRDANPLSMTAAAALFGDMASQAHIPFDFAKGYCSARAHEMRRLINEQGVDCRKVFFHAAKDHSIRVEHPTNGTILWSYHVAPTVAVQTPQGVVRMVIDPSLFDRPVTVEEWTSVMTCEKSVLEHTSGAVYQPFDARDDEYRQTERLLEEARVVAEAWRRAGDEMERAETVAAARAAADALVAQETAARQPETVETAWEDGIVPETWEDDGIVPDEDSAEDDDAA